MNKKAHEQKKPEKHDVECWQVEKGKTKKIHYWSADSSWNW
jgi:hypothetical protein